MIPLPVLIKASTFVVSTVYHKILNVIFHKHVDMSIDDTCRQVCWRPRLVCSVPWLRHACSRCLCRAGKACRCRPAAAACACVWLVVCSRKSWQLFACWGPLECRLIPVCPHRPSVCLLSLASLGHGFHQHTPQKEIYTLRRPGRGLIFWSLSYGRDKVCTRNNFLGYTYFVPMM